MKKMSKGLKVVFAISIAALVGLSIFVGRMCEKC